MRTCSIEEYFNGYKHLPIVDVRSNGEYEQGHIPNAISFPLLNNEERVIVGTCYKQQGHKAAVIKGFELVGGKFAQYLIDFEKVTSSQEVVVHCWRGGLRSNIMAWLLEKGGYKPILLTGGYKKFRAWTQTTFSSKHKIVVLGGKTGSKKTKLLHELNGNSEHIIDLEKLANHKGSAFGGIGLGAQPTQEQFENELAFAIHQIPKDDFFWIENESRLVGKCIIPAQLFEQMKESPLIEIEVSKHLRAKNIIDEYGRFERKLLVEKTMEVEKKLGNQNMRNAIAALLENDFDTWVNYLLDYYDKGYANSKLKVNRRDIHMMQFSNNENVDDLIRFKNEVLNRIV